MNTASSGSSESTATTTQTNISRLSHIIHLCTLEDWRTLFVGEETSLPAIRLRAVGLVKNLDELAIALILDTTDIPAQKQTMLLALKASNFLFSLE